MKYNLAEFNVYLARRIETHQSKLCLLFVNIQRSFVIISGRTKTIDLTAAVLKDKLSTCLSDQSRYMNFDPYDN